jgi:hypothetical protein
VVAAQKSGIVWRYILEVEQTGHANGLEMGLEMKGKAEARITLGVSV